MMLGTERLGPFRARDAPIMQHIALLLKNARVSGEFLTKVPMPNDYSPVAEYYDEYVRSTLDIPFFLEECGRADGEVLELMAGTGRVSLPLADAGVKLTCVDSSAEMIGLLRRKFNGLHRAPATYVMDVRDLDLPELFNLAILPFHAFAELVSEEDRMAFLAGVYRHLRPGGRFICTMHNPQVRTNTVDGALRIVARCDMREKDHTLLVWLAERAPDAAGVIDAVQIFEEYDLEHILRVRKIMPMRYSFISREEAGSLFTRARFVIESMYGDYSRTPFAAESSQFMIWILRR
jgi:SAM-dependent methyltransferase